jgi:hypothetical protein
MVLDTGDDCVLSQLVSAPVNYFRGIAYLVCPTRLGVQDSELET